MTSNKTGITNSSAIQASNYNVQFADTAIHGDVAAGTGNTIIKVTNENTKNYEIDPPNTIFKKLFQSLKKENLWNVLPWKGTTTGITN